MIHPTTAVYMLFFILPSIRAGAISGVNQNINPETMWTVCIFNRLSKESKEAETDCCICLESLEYDRTCEEKKLLCVCAASPKHVFHAYCVLQSAAGTIAPSCALCRQPLPLISFSGYFENFFRREAAKGLTAVRESNAYMFILTQHILISLMKINYTRLYIQERILLLSILDSMQCPSPMGKGKPANMKYRVYACELYLEILRHGSGVEGFPHILISHNTCMLDQIGVPQNEATIEYHLRYTAPLILSAKEAGRFSFPILCNLIYLIIQSTASLDFKYAALCQVLGDHYPEASKSKLPEMLALLQLFTSILDESEFLFLIPQRFRALDTEKFIKVNLDMLCSPINTLKKLLLPDKLGIQRLSIEIPRLTNE